MSNLYDELMSAPQSFEFFSAVRVLQFAEPDKPPVGCGIDPESEVCRFQPSLSLVAPSSPIESFEAGDKLMRIGFFGLYGRMGALPWLYTEYMIRHPKDEEGLRHFLDIINNRFIALFYRAHEKYRLYAAAVCGNSDSVQRPFHALLGGDVSAPGTDDRSLGRLLRYAGLFSQRPRSAAALEALVCDFFDGVRARVEQFVGRWVPMAQVDQGQLGGQSSTNLLGQNAVVGAQVYDRRGKFRLHLGPLRISDYVRFLPGEPAFRDLCHLVRQFSGDHTTFDVRLILKSDEIPPLVLPLPTGEAETDRRPIEAPLRLGLNTWISASEVCDEVADAIFTPSAGPTGGTQEVGHAV